MAAGRREALILGAAGLAAAAAGFVVGPVLFGGRKPEADPALMAAPFPDLEGKPRRLLEWKGRVIVCNFWATWCAPCREEIPLLVSTRRKYAAKSVEIVGIAVDNKAKVIEFAKSLSIPYPVLLSDAEGLDFMRKLGNSSGGLPYTVFFDRQGRPARQKLGALKAAELDRILTDLTAE